MIRTYIFHHLQILGEAASQLSSEFRSQHPEIPWSKILGTRNILVHAYFQVDYDIVWGVTQTDLPDLKLKIEKILGQE